MKSYENSSLENYKYISLYFGSVHAKQHYEIKHGTPH